jgi:hypothetical protein
VPKDKPKAPGAPRARRLEDLIEQGPRPPRSPHEFVEQRMREERRKARETNRKK